MKGKNRKPWKPLALIAVAGILAIMTISLHSNHEFFYASENCGISGMVLFPKEHRTEQELELIRILAKELLVVTAKRGTDATGIVLFNKQKQSALLKLPQKGPAFVKLPEFKEYLKKITQDTTIIIGHNRAASKAMTPQNNNNNHPVHIGSIYLVHNGYISNHNQLFKKYKFHRIGEVDTEVIAHMIAHHSKDKITTEKLQKACAELKGGMAVAFADERDPYHLYLIRNTPPMTYVTVPHLELLIFNSELRLIRKAWKRAVAAFLKQDLGLDLSKITFKEEVKLPKNSGVVVDVEKKTVISFDPFP